MQIINVAAVLGLAAFAMAAPQESNSVSSAVASASSAAASVTATGPAGPQNSCVLACGKDTCCQAACVGVPCPDAGAVNKTTECAAKCVQGDGSEAETAKYAACQQACIQQNFFSSGASGAAGTSTDDSASATGESGAAATGSDSPASSASRSASSAASSASAAATGTGAASSLQIGSSAVGIVGLLVAALAL